MTDLAPAALDEPTLVDRATADPAPARTPLVDPATLDRGVDPAGAIEQVLDELATDPRLVHVRRLAPRAPRTGVLSRALPAELSALLPHQDLWQHQARAIDLAREGRGVVVATGTASGKSLCYQVPIAEAVHDGGTALAIYPTKALAQDQLLSFASWEAAGVLAATYDGDCTPEERTWVRSNANVVLTNPEMLHHGILSNHERWARLLHGVRYVVVDELHTLRGVFGTHLAQILRRLRRLIAHYGGQEPTFVFTSATIGRPAELATELCGLPVVAVTDDGAPVGARTVALWHPGADGLGHGRADRHDHPRWSVHAEAGLVAARLIRSGLRTLVFCRSRRATELVAEDLRRTLGPELAGRIRAYRAGYLPSERREIEAELFGGQLRGIVATNALELGVDIGGLDAVVLCGFPGTIASFWQQVGRSGRSGQDSLSVLVAGQDQLDQWMQRHPDELFSRPPEPAVINLDNPHVVVPHLACAAHELPLRHEDAGYWPDQLDDGVRELVLGERARVQRRRGRRVAVWSGRGVPAPTIGLRSASRGEYRIEDTDGQVIGTVDDARACSVVHPGAVYLHQGRAWQVLELDHDRCTAVVAAASGDEYTQPRSDTSIRLLRVDDERTVGASTLRLGTVEVTTQVVGYRRRSTRTHEVLAREDLTLPASQLSTRAVWYSIDQQVLDAAQVDDAALPGALHAAEHAAIGILPLFTICDRWDVGGVSTPWLPETDAPTVVIHDAHPGGAGIAELAFAAADRHLAATRTVIAECPCEGGCPSCVQSPKCGNNNEPLDKDAARRLLGAVLAPERT